jgi:hypothetical protein
MSTAPNSAYKYQVGGSLQRDSPTYVVRQADEDFYQALKTGEFCYVLNSRQMGKSSLRVQTMQRLQTDGIACGVIDITSIGSHDIAPAEWYLSFIGRLARSLGVKKTGEVKAWWNDRQGSSVARFGEFIEEVLLAEIPRNIVIFIDEIDSILKLDFKDDFFALIRACYNQRADNPEYRRLTFALLGVTTPSDLIQDKSRTSFNIGKPIDLLGFQLHEVQPLAKGLEGKADNPQEVLKYILDWTGGQPFLTQKLCKLVLSSPFTIAAHSEAKLIEQLVRSHIIKNWESQDEPEHLRTIRDRILSSEQQAGQRLGLYQKILQQQGILADDSPEHMEVRLTGLVVKRHSNLEVYNPIYSEVFDHRWVNRELAKLRPRFYNEAITAWLASNCQDKSQLLRGQALQEAERWAATRRLSDVDNQFLKASREHYIQELEKVVGPTNLKFKDEEVSSPLDLIDKCDKYPEIAEDYLFNGYLEEWLFIRSQTELANLSKKIVDSYQSERRRGLEMFVRGLCEHLERHPYPEIFFEPRTIDLGEIPVGSQNRLQLKILNKERGLAWGDVSIDGNLPGITLPEEKFDSSNETFDVDLDTLEVPPDNYYGDIVIALEGISELCRIPIHYTVRKLVVHIEPTELDLGVIPYDESFINTALKITCESAKTRLKGTASTDMEHLQMTPDSFEGSSLEVSLLLDTTSLEAGSYKTEISLKTNSGEFKVPIRFIKSLKWDIIAGLTAGIAIITGICMYAIRDILGNHLSVGLDDAWMLSYPPEVRVASFLRLISPLSLFELPQVLLTCSIFGLAVISVISSVVAYIFRDYLEEFTDKISSTLQVFLNVIGESIENIASRIAEQNQRLYRYYYSPRRIIFIYKTVKILLLILVFCGIVGLTTNSLVNIAAWIGASFIILADLTTYPITWFGINQPTFGWLALSLFIGGVLGLIQALNRTKEYSLLSKVHKYTATIALLLAFSTFLNSGLKPAIDPFPKLALEENFNYPSKYWSLPPGTAIKDGGLFQQEPNKRTISYSLWYGNTFEDVDFSAKVKRTNAPNNVAFGIIARYTQSNKSSTNGNFYYLLIKGNGKFAMGKYSESQGWEDKVGWQNSIAMKQGNNEWNQLRLVCNGKRVIGWVNEQRVGIFEDDSYNYGQIGIISARGDSDAVAVYFDNVLVKEKLE